MTYSDTQGIAGHPQLHVGRDKILEREAGRLRKYNWRGTETEIETRDIHTGPMLSLKNDAAWSSVYTFSASDMDDNPLVR